MMDYFHKFLLITLCFLTFLFFDNYFKKESKWDIDSNIKTKGPYDFTSIRLEENDKFYYYGEYHMNIPNGLVRITSKIDYDELKKPILYPEILYPKESIYINVDILRHDSNVVKVQAFLDKNIATLVDVSYPNQTSWHNLHDPWGSYGDYKNEEHQWVPWIDDVQFNDIIKYFWRSKRYFSLRGGNRLNLDLRYPGNYTITIPKDCDISANLIDGDIKYYHDINYFAYIVADAKDINRMGHSGGFNGQRQHWSYYYGDMGTNPYIDLRTQNGFVGIY